MLLHGKVLMPTLTQARCNAVCRSIHSLSTFRFTLNNMLSNPTMWWLWWNMNVFYVFSEITDLQIIRDGLVNRVTDSDLCIEEHFQSLVPSSMIYFQTFNSEKHFPNVTHHHFFPFLIFKAGERQFNTCNKDKSSTNENFCVLSLSLMEIQAMHHWELYVCVICKYLISFTLKS